MKPDISVAPCWQAGVGHFSVISTRFIPRLVPFLVRVETAKRP